MKILQKEYVSGFYPKEESELVAAGYEYIVDGWYAALRIVLSRDFALKPLINES